MYIYSFGLGYLENERIAGDKLVTSVSNHCTFASLHLRCVVCTIYQHHQCSPLYAYIYMLWFCFTRMLSIVWWLPAGSMAIASTNLALLRHKEWIWMHLLSNLFSFLLSVVFIFVEAPRNKADARDLRKARSTNEPKYSINNSGEHLTDHCNIEHIYI